jgi:RND family efflux transporter MFP subunit
MKRYITLGALAGVALILLLAARSGGRAAPSTGADSIAPAVLGPNDVATAQLADLIAGVPVSGTLDPAVDIRITAPAPDQLDAVLAKEGQSVRQGQVLARFRTTAVGPAAASAEAQRRLAAADFERMRSLYQEGAVSQRDVENAEVALRGAEAAAALATKRLEEATVRAPASGVIAARLVDGGARVKDGDLLFRLVDVRALEFTATVPSEFAGQVRPGARVVLAVTGATDVAVGGRVARVNATVDEETRQVQVYVTVPNADRKLVGGLHASGRIVLREVNGAVAIPQAGLRRTDTATYVYVVDNGRIARREVVAGAVDEATLLVEIRAGLRAGETVIVGPVEGLAPGQAVTVTGAEG